MDADDKAILAIALLKEAGVQYRVVPEFEQDGSGKSVIRTVTVEAWKPSQQEWIAIDSLEAVEKLLRTPKDWSPRDGRQVHGKGGSA